MDELLNQDIDINMIPPRYLVIKVNGQYVKVLFLVIIFFSIASNQDHDNQADND